MSVKIVVPELGESVVEATIGRWFKKEGDPVTVGEPVLELETDKVNLEIAASQAGVLARIERKEGEDVRVGEVVGLIEPRAGVDQPAKRPAATESKAEAGKPAAEAKAEPSRPATESGAGEAMAERATPVARRMAEELGLDLAQISGSGSRGQITKDDVRAFVETQTPRRPVGPSGPDTPFASPRGQAGVPAINENAGRPVETTPPPVRSEAVLAHQTTPSPARETRQRMSRRRRTIAQRLVAAQHSAAMLTTFNEIDMSAVIDIRRRRQEAFKGKHGVKLGFMSFFVKAAIGALKAFPQLNAEIEGEDLVLKHYYDIGIAVGAEEGLVVPVLKDADRMSFAAIEQAIQAFAEKAQNNTLSIEDLRGGTFTLTNGGVFGSLLSTPILNPPQVGILGLHKIEERPMAAGGQVIIRPMMYVALSYDHRIVDGREAVQFLVKVKELVEDPASLLLES